MPIYKQYNYTKEIDCINCKYFKYDKCTCGILNEFNCNFKKIKTFTKKYFFKTSILGRSFTRRGFKTKEGARDAETKFREQLIDDNYLRTLRTNKTYSELFIEYGNYLKENLKTVLFFAGGKFGLGKSRTLEIFNTFVNDFNNIQVIAISGKNKKMYEEFNQIVKIANKTNFIKVFEFVNNVPELMAVSDVVITKPGGLTTTESLVSGLPMIIINPIPGQEEENAQFLEHSNVGIWLKKQMNITETISNFLSDNKKLKQMKENTKKISNRNSTKDICTILEAGLN